MPNFDHAFIMEFIEIYKLSPCLWNKKDPNYHNANSRVAAYSLLLDKYKEYNVKATMALVKSKINNLRTTFSKELRKVKDSEAGTGEIYRPALWYYDLISFVGGRQPTQTTVKTMEEDEEEDDNNEEPVNFQSVAPKLNIQMVESNTQEVKLETDVVYQTIVNIKKELHEEITVNDKPKSTMVENEASEEVDQISDELADLSEVYIKYESDGGADSRENLVEFQGNEQTKKEDEYSAHSHSSDQEFIRPSPSRSSSKTFSKRSTSSRMKQVVSNKKLVAQKFKKTDNVRIGNHESFGKHIAEELNNMAPEMVPYVKKIINLAIFEGHMKSLNTSSSIVTELGHVSELDFPMGS